jgi:hypothetical protein
MSDDVVCPKCGWDNVMDVYSCTGCLDPNPILHCGNCGCVFDPKTSKILKEDAE